MFRDDEVGYVVKSKVLSEGDVTSYSNRANYCDAGEFMCADQSGCCPNRYYCCLNNLYCCESGTSSCCNPQSSSSTSSEGLSSGAVAGIVISVLVCCGIIGYFILRRAYLIRRMYSIIGVTNEIEMIPYRTGTVENSPQNTIHSQPQATPNPSHDAIPITNTPTTSYPNYTITS